MECKRKGGMDVREEEIKRRQWYKGKRGMEEGDTGFKKEERKRWGWRRRGSLREDGEFMNGKSR